MKQRIVDTRLVCFGTTWSLCGNDSRVAALEPRARAVESLGFRHSTIIREVTCEPCLTEMERRGWIRLEADS
jgi:hypothetical protein